MEYLLHAWPVEYLKFQILGILSPILQLRL